MMHLSSSCGMPGTDVSAFACRDKMGLLAFSWMKRPMPSEINLVVAYADDAYADGDDKEKTEMGASRQRGMQRSALEDLLLGFEIVPIALPSAKRCQNMVETMLRHNSKTLSDDQKKLLKEWLEKDDKHRHPLTLSLISEELRSFGIFESLVADTRFDTHCILAALLTLLWRWDVLLLSASRPG